MVALSAVLPENGLLKKLAFLFDQVVCDNLSFHFVSGETDGMRARSRREWNTAYDARVKELRWLQDAGIVLPLARFAEEIGLPSDELDRVRRGTQAEAARLTHGDGQEQTVAFMSAYERLLAANLQSYGIRIISVTPVPEFENNLQRPSPEEDDTTVVEVLLPSIPNPDELASWNAILELRRDPMLEVSRQELWDFIEDAGVKDLERNRLRALLQRCETMFELHRVKIAHTPLQSVTFVGDRFNSKVAPSGTDTDFVTIKCHRIAPIWRKYVQQAKPISCAFTDVKILADLQSEVPTSVFDFITMISFPDLGREKPELDDLVALARQFNRDAGLAFLARLNSYLSLAHLSNDRDTIAKVQRQLSTQILSAARLGEIVARFSDKGLHGKWILLHRAQLLVGIKLVARYGQLEGGRRLKSADERAMIGELALAINSYYGPGLKEPDRPLGDVLAQMAAEAELHRAPDLLYGLVRTRVLLGPLLRRFSVSLGLAGHTLPPFERIFTLLNGLNFHDFLDITIYFLSNREHDPKEAIDTGSSWYLDSAEFNQYVSGRSTKAWADLMSIEPGRIGEILRGSEAESIFFYDFTDARRYPLWRVDGHRYFAIDWFFLMERLSSFGVYWTIVNGLVDEELRSKFQFVWGDLVEEYVRDLLSRSVGYGVGALLRRPTYDDGKTEVFDSAIVIGHSLIAIEIKGSVVPSAHKYAGEAGAFFQGLSAKFGGGKGAAVEQLLRNIELIFRETDAQHVASIPTDEIKEILPVVVVHEPVLRSGFASHGLAAEFRAGVSRLRLEGRYSEFWHFKLWPLKTSRDWNHIWWTESSRWLIACGPKSTKIQNINGRSGIS